MDGTKRKEIIQSWLSTVVEEGERGRGHELHVDQIDESWEQESEWVSAALESFDIARRIRDEFRSSTEWSVVTAFFLSSGSIPTGMTFDNRSEMMQAFSFTPPALFLWRAGDEFWARAETRKDKIEDLNLKVLNAEDFFDEQHAAFKCVFMECTWDGLEEYFRAVYLAG